MMQAEVTYKTGENIMGDKQSVHAGTATLLSLQQGASQTGG